MKNLLLFLIVSTFIHTLQAQTWIRQNPFPKLAQLQDIDFDGPYGLAVGDESTCFTTDNGGITWIPRTLPQDGYAFDAALVVPGTNGQIMFAGGIQLLKTENGGTTWEVIHNSPGNIHRIQVLASGEIIALGQDNNLISDDLGLTWDVIPNPVDGSSAGHFTDALHGWVESGNFNNSQVWVTTDGGQSWDVRDTLRHPVIYGIQMLDQLTGFLAARDYVYKTTDGGHHWLPMHANAVNSIQDLHVVNENEIWTCLINGFIFFTRDGGNMWSEINPNIISANKTNGIYANDAGQVWSTGKFVSIIYSDDAGTSWTDQIPNAKSIMYQPHFLNEDQGLVGGSAGTVLWTENGGASWDRLHLGDDENLFAVQRLDAQTAIAGSSSGTVFATVNAGQDWQIIGQNLGQIADLHAFTAARGIVISESGIIWRTTTAGAQWDNVYQSPSGLFEALHFTDNLNGWACGWFGQIVHTSDGGMTWTPQTTNSNAQFSDIHFADPMHGWAVSSAFTDTVWHTQNGGQTWEKSQLPNKLFWHGVSFHSADTGWVAGGSAGSGFILRTNNGGQTWEFDHQSPEALFGIYAVPGKETAWSTGVGGNIVKYSPCTFNPVVSAITGPDQPCQKDTVMYTVSFSDVDIFEWDYPSDWLVYGNSNTSSLQLIVGLETGFVRVTGKDACNNESTERVFQVSSIAVPNAVITFDGYTLSCDLGSGFYQWLLEGSEVPGATDQTYVPTVPGSYEVVVTTFATGCEVRSNALDVIISSTRDLNESRLKVYPNPVTDWMRIVTQLNEPLPDGIRMKLCDISGVSVFESLVTDSQVELPNLASGIYVVSIRNRDEIWQGKILVAAYK